MNERLPAGPMGGGRGFGSAGTLVRAQRTKKGPVNL
jgi:hypothetical protein